jgi:hypothetical protein
VTVRRITGLLLALATVAGACTGSEEPAAPSGSASATAPPAPTTSVPAPVRAGGAPTVWAAIRDLCVAPDLPSGGRVKPGETPPAIAEVEAQVEQVRGLDYLEQVAAEPIDDATMDRKLETSFEAYYPEDLYARRTAAWRTIGAIPPDADLREALRTYLTGQVVGFYDPQTGELVYLGDQGEELGLMEKMVLAHELTHAIDDQHFDLTRLDDLVAGCRDEEFAAALAVVEGSAQYFSTEVLIEYPDMDLADALAALAGALTSEQDLSGVPPFVQALQQWPYLAGQAFVTKIAIADGDDAVDDALRNAPVSTEQILHADRYPGDVPTRVDLPDISPALGEGWGDLDAMEVGEAWLAALLDLHLDAGEAAEAAAGWDGGVYRAWTDGEQVVVALVTAWDTPEDAAAFADALGAWLDAAGTPGKVLSVDDRTTAAVFATDAGLVDEAAAALG